MIKKSFIVVLLFTGNLIFAQSENNELKLTGSLSVDSKLALVNYTELSIQQFQYKAGEKKSPLLAGLFSAVLPGAGEFYAEEYWKAAIFAVLEAGLITTGLVYDNKGDKKTEEFQNFADDYKNPDHHWSVVKYAQWLAENKSGVNYSSIVISDDQNLPPWERVNWEALNEAEKDFSHKLPRHGDQQYYELIGKYPQYSPGWNDYTGGSEYHQISPNYIFYSGERGKANDYYNVAAKSVIGIYLNHFLSTLDAVYSTIQYNKDLSVKFRLEEMPLTNSIEYIPTVYATLSF